MALHYKSYAFSHTIIEDDIRIVHEFRDQEFEKEMSNIGLPINGKTITGNQYSMSAYGLHFAGSWFEFVDKLIVYYDGQEISISRKRNDSELDYPRKQRYSILISNLPYSGSSLRIKPRKELRKQEVLKTIFSKLPRRKIKQWRLMTLSNSKPKILCSYGKLY